jgi:RimJ/RimL family protein N-acetyltransferase
MMPDKPTLTGSRVQLRPIAHSDIDAYLELLQDEEGLRLTGTQTTGFTREQAQQWIADIGQRDDRYDLAIVPRGQDALVGEVVLNEIDGLNRSANIRIGIRKPCTDRGYGSEALRLMLAYAFDELRMHRVALAVYAFNLRAIHVYQKLGFRHEGVLREVLWSEGAYHDVIVMSILESECRYLRPGATD